MPVSIGTDVSKVVFRCLPTLLTLWLRSPRRDIRREWTRSGLGQYSGRIVQHAGIETWLEVERLAERTEEYSMLSAALLGTELVGGVGCAFGMSAVSAPRYWILGWVGEAERRMRRGATLTSAIASLLEDVNASLRRRAVPIESWTILGGLAIDPDDWEMDMFDGSKIRRLTDSEITELSASDPMSPQPGDDFYCRGNWVHVAPHELSFCVADAIEATELLRGPVIDCVTDLYLVLNGAIWTLGRGGVANSGTMFRVPEVGIPHLNGSKLLGHHNPFVSLQLSLSELAQLKECYAAIRTHLAGSHLRGMLSSLARATADPRNELVHVYELRDALAREFSGDRNAIKGLGLSSSSWARLGFLANGAPIHQGRHRGEHGEALRDATAAELSEARGIAATFLRRYLIALQGAPLPVVGP